MLKDYLNDLKGKVNSIDELRALAKEKGVKFTEEELKTGFDYLSGKEVDLYSLENVSGGACSTGQGGSTYGLGWC